MSSFPPFGKITAKNINVKITLIYLLTWREDAFCIGYKDVKGLK